MTFAPRASPTARPGPVAQRRDDRGEQLLGLGPGEQDADRDHRHAEPPRGTGRVADEQLGAAEQQHGCAGDQQPARHGSCTGRRPRPPSSTATAASVVVDGPFSEAKEVVGGFSVIDVPDLDAAVAMVHDLAVAGVARRRSVEIRPMVVDYSRSSSDRPPTPTPTRLLARTIRAGGRPAASRSLSRRFGDFDVAEEAVQDAVRRGAGGAGGATGTPTGRVPGCTRPRAATLWTCCARRRARHGPAAGRALRRPRADGGRRRATAPTTGCALLFACCHPALAPEARLALTLRAVVGLTTAADRPRLPRPASRRWRSGSCGPSARSSPPASRCAIPDADELAGRLDDVLAVVYVMFNEAFVSTFRRGRHDRDLGDDARLALRRARARSLPDAGRGAGGWLALLPFQHARAAGALRRARRPRPARATRTARSTATRPRSPASRSRPAGPAATGRRRGPPARSRAPRPSRRCRCTAPAAAPAARCPPPSQRSSASARSREFAATPPPISRWSTPCSVQASTALRVSTSTTASWKAAATSATGTGSPSRSRVSTQRATAVFRPENEKS